MKNKQSKTKAARKSGRELVEMYLNIPMVTLDILDHDLLHKEHTEAGAMRLLSCRVCSKLQEDNEKTK